MASNDAPIEDCTPATELVYRLLEETGPATINELDARTCCADSTIRTVLYRLEDAGVVERQSALSGEAKYRWRII